MVATLGTTTVVPQLAAGKKVQVRLLEASDHGWDEFVLGHPHGSPFHMIAWKRSIEETFGYQPMYLIAVETTQVRGVLPLFLVKNLLVRSALISTPFAVYGGVLADSGEVRDLIRDHVKALAQSLGVQYLELRNAHPDQCLGFSRVSRYVTFTQEIGPDEEAILLAIPRKTRRMVRISLKSNLSARQQMTDLSAFEDLYSRSLRRLGTPSFPPKHFARLIANFGDMVDIREVMAGGKVIAAVMSFYFRDRVLPYYGASDLAFNSLAPSNFMYFDQMRWAGENGYRIFDFGRSKKTQSGSYEFKSHWGMMETELPYEMLLVKGKTLPHFSPNNPKFQAAIKVWRQLPLCVTRKLGPRLVRLFP